MKKNDLIERVKDGLRGIIIEESKLNKHCWFEKLFLVEFNKNKKEWLKEKEIKFIEL